MKRIRNIEETFPNRLAGLGTTHYAYALAIAGTLIIPWLSDACYVDCKSPMERNGSSDGHSEENVMFNSAVWKDTAKTGDLNRVLHTA